MGARDRPGAPGLLGLVVVLVSLLVCRTEAALQITSSLTRVEAMLGEDVTIPCVLADDEKTQLDLDLSTVSVRWNMESSNGSARPVLLSIQHKQNQYRSGSNVDIDKLRRGIASLSMSDVQITDEGEYTCSVTVTPDKVTAKIALRVIARPIVTLMPHNLTVEPGHERSVTCGIAKFYPKSIAIRWFRSHKGSGIQSALDKETCNSVPVENHDGTFNATSLVLLKPSSTGEDGDVYSCVVSHTSFSGDRAFHFTLTVKEPAAASNTGTVLIVLFSTLTPLLIAGFLLMCINKGPSLSNITGAEYMVHMKNSMLTSMISGFKPNKFTINLYVKRDGDDTRQRVCSWKYPSEVLKKHNSTFLRVEEQPPTEDCVGGTDTVKAVLKPLKPKKSFLYYHCLCIVHVTPDIERDEGAELTLEVEHPALRSPKSVHCNLKINGDLLRLDPIEASQHPTHGQQVTLTCRMTKFIPGPLHVCWLIEDSSRPNLTETICEDGKIFNDRFSHTLTPEELHRGQGYMTSSSLTFTVNVKEDHGKTYNCRVCYRAICQTEQTGLDMSVRAFPVAEPIKTKPAEPSVGQQTKLSCRICSFYPRELRVEWWKECDVSPLTSNTTITEDEDGLYSATSTLTFTPKFGDISKTFQCEIQHESLEEATILKWSLLPM